MRSNPRGLRVGGAVTLAVLVAVGFGGRSARGPANLIAFDANPAGPGYGGIFMANLASGRVWQVDHGGGEDPSWSPTGAQIAFDRESNGPCDSPYCSRIFLMSADGSHRRPFTPAHRRCEQASWSPTGDRIAYVQWRHSPGSNNRASIWIRAVDGSDAHRLTFAKAFDSAPVWSPDGSRIVFSRDTQGSGYGNWIVNTDGSNLHRLRGNPDTVIESWSPDGLHMTGSRSYGRYNNRFVSVVVNADGSGERVLLRGAYGPVWSPDSRRVAFLSEEEDDWVGVVRADGTHRHKLFRGNFFQPQNLDWLRPGIRVHPGAGGQ